MHWSRVSTIASLALAIAAARPTLAQQADMIRGRVTAQNGVKIEVEAFHYGGIWNA